MLQFITHQTPRFGIVEGAVAALKGGCKWIQLRMKEAPLDVVEQTARQLIPLCKEHEAILVLDDYPQLAADLDIDGVHLGKLDMPVSEARLLMRGYAEKKASLDAVIADFVGKVDAAEESYVLAFGEEAPFYDEIVNTAFDAAENAYIAAQAVNLTGDAATGAAREKWDALQGKYNGVRFTTEFEAAMNGVPAMAENPTLASELEKALGEAQAKYEKIPEIDRGKVAESKAAYDAAVAKLPALKAQNAFILSVSAVDLTTAIDLGALREAAAAAKENWNVLVEEYEYVSGVPQVDDAKAALDGKEADIKAVGEYVSAVGELPAVDEQENTKEVYDKLTAVEQTYDGLTQVQQEYPLVANAYMTYSAANSKFESQKTDMFSVPAFDKSGTPVEQGFAMLGIDAESGLISGIGAQKNYLQIVYAVASHAQDHKINGIVIDEQNFANVDAEEVQSYIKNNFEYIFSVYDASGAYVGAVRKDVVFDEAAQAPSLAELQQFFPLYHNESGKVGYSYGVAVGVQADAADESLHYTIRDSAEVKGSGSSIDGLQDPDTMSMLSPANLIALEDKDGGGTIQLMRINTAVCAYGQSLNYQYVGAYDLYFYLGDEISDANLIEWVRTVRETGTNKEGTYVRNFRGKSLEEKGLVDSMKTDQEYISLGVEDITATVKGPSGNHKDHGWMISGTKGYTNAWTRASVLSELFTALGHHIPQGTEVTVVAQLKVNAAGAEAGIKDSPFSAPVHITF